MHIEILVKEADTRHNSTLATAFLTR